MPNGQSGLSTNDFLAERVRQQLAVFPLRFKQLNEGGELRDVVQTTDTLAGPLVRQAPEDFTEQYLIEPILHGLGYLNPISEEYAGTGPHFVRRPSTFRKIEDKRPDYKFENLDPEAVCILEAKAAGNEQPDGSKQKATADIKKYTEVNTFAKYLKSREQRYLIAIGTDGLRWTLRAKDVRSGATREGIRRVDLAPAIEAIAQRKSVIEGTPSLSQSEVRAYLADEFVHAFSARRLTDCVRTQFD